LEPNFPHHECPRDNDIIRLVSLFNQGKDIDVEREAKALISRFPKYGLGWKVLGAVLHKMGRLEEALYAKREALNLSPEDPEGYNNLANLLYTLERFSEARLLLVRALDLNPTYVSAHNNLGLVCLKQNDLSTARHHFSRVIEISPDFAEAYNNLGVIAQKMGFYDEAENCFISALDVDQNYVDALNNLGVNRFNQKQFDSASIYFLRTLGLAPDNFIALNNLGVISLSRGDLSEAVSFFTKLSQLASPSTYATHCLGMALYHQGRLSSAIETFKKNIYLEKDRWSIESMVYLAVHHYLSGQYDEVVEIIRVCGGFKSNADPKIAIYFDYLELFLTSKSKHGENFPNGSEGVIHVIGESHALPFHRSRVMYRSNLMECKSEWIVGCKQWHLSNNRSNRFRSNFETIIQRIPRGSNLLIAVGEIDCRPDEGILKAKQKYPSKSIQEIAAETISGYIDYLTSFTTKFDHKLIICGVPASNISLKIKDRALAEQLIQLIRFFNRTLQAAARREGLDFLDVFSLTDRGDGASNRLWHMDDVHLTPEAIPEAFSKYLVLAQNE
jgi:tetratricopeptide (TPR) repeat protein